MLNADQRQRVSLLKSMCHCSKKEAVDALEKNYWDTSMASEWIRLTKERTTQTLEEFHAAYQKARSQSAVLPSDRYDVQETKAKPNRQQRRASKKSEKKKKK